MSKAFSKTLISVMLAIAAVTACFGQPSASKVKAFDVGESITYEAKASKIISGIAVADLSFLLQKAPGSDEYVIKTEAVSKGTLLKLFRYSFLEQYESLVDPLDFGIRKTTKHDVQKDRVRDSVADFDYANKRVTFTESDPKEPNRPPRRIASDLPGPMNDIISAIYAMRMRPLAVGQSFTIPISDSGLVFDIPVKIAAREQQKTAIGKFWCLRIEPELFGENKLIEQKGSVTIWVTDDHRHLPVRGRVETEAFKVDVKIRSVTNTPPPAT
ncbi:MAG: DUF3108 domain-containing protein [Acidobacteriota bacterium]